MIKRPEGVGVFQFVVLAGLRAAQLTRGCTPRVAGTHKRTVMAQMEIADGMVKQSFEPLIPAVALAAPGGGLVIDDPTGMIQAREI